VLELAVLGGVDERVDAAVGEHQHDEELMVPAGKSETVGGEAHDSVELVRREADNETAADQQ